ncbi:potassium channel subfamily K member 18-like [Diadema antillarum]|uniref:potassium channel subfamily K member 18-like n=1 Tax=Diadema antillarum TaxID=105358 RepID=UPI003A86AA78
MDDDEDKDESVAGKCADVVRSMLPHSLLIIVYLIYLAVGGVVFSALEMPHFHVLSEQEHAQLAEANRTRLTILEAYHNVSMGIMKPEELNISRLLDSLIDTVNHPDWKAGRQKALMMGRDWSFPSAMLFSLTTITTIGYGDLAPDTLWGKVFCVAYSAVGVPFSFFLLADIGQVLAIAFIKLVRCCCRKQQSTSENNSSQSKEHRVYPTLPSVREDTPDSQRKTTKEGRKGAKPDVTMRHLKSIRNPMENSGDKRGQASQRGAQPKTDPVDDKAIEMSDLGTCSVDSFNLNSNNSGFDRTSQMSCCDNPSNGNATAREEKKEHLHPEDTKMKDTTEVNDKEEEFSNYHENDVPIFLVLFVLVSYMLISAYAFMVVEGWDYGTSVYFIFITLTTIGFGDVVPNEQYTPQVFFFCLLFTIVGLAVTSMCIALSQDTVARAGKRLMGAIRQRMVIDDSDKDPEQGHGRSNQG